MMKRETQQRVCSSSSSVLLTYIHGEQQQQQFLIEVTSGPPDSLYRASLTVSASPASIFYLPITWIPHPSTHLFALFLVEVDQRRRHAARRLWGATYVLHKRVCTCRNDQRLGRNHRKPGRSFDWRVCREGVMVAYFHAYPQKVLL